MKPDAAPWTVAAGLAALGALQTLAFVHTAAWPLPLAAVAVLVACLDRARHARQAALWGLAFGTGWLVAGTWWLFISMHRYGHLPAWLASAAVAALAGLLSLYLAAAAGAYRHWRRGGATDVALFAALWLLAELARAVLFTGFPWVASGYAQVDGPLAVLAPWIGVYGIGAVTAALAAALAALPHGTQPPRGRPFVPVAAAAALLACGISNPSDHTQAGRTLSVELLQPNVAQDVKFAADRMDGTLTWLAGRLMSSRADLVVAPETAVPLLPDDLEAMSPGYWATLRQRFADGRQAALVGVPLGDLQRGYTNSVAGLSAAPPYRYDKHHLVPFGEFIPTGFRWFTEMMRIPLGDFARGAVAQPSFDVAGERAAPHICYEDLFGEELARRFADPARAPTLFVNVSNIGWFGDTAAVGQHLGIARMRALEFQLPVVRATNTGATAAIDHRGRVLARLPAFTEGVLAAQVQARRGQTPYARWASVAGHGPLALLAVLVCWTCVRRRAA